MKTPQLPALAGMTPLGIKPAKTRTRYAITKVTLDGFRVFAHANQGRNHFDTKPEAEKHLAAILANNSEDRLRQCYGDVKKMRVDPVECYEHGDAINADFGDKIYVAKFKGRKLGAIGIRHQIEAAVGGDNEDDARLNLYQRYQDISDLRLEVV